MEQPDSNKERPEALRFGVMCSGKSFQRWQADALEELRRHGHHLTLLVVNAQQPKRTSRIKRFLDKKWTNILFTTLENRLFLPDAKRQVNLEKEMTGVDVLKCSLTRKGFSEYFQEADIRVIREHNLDFMLRFGFGILRGEILKATRYGIWSFHHDDEMKYRGGPAGFWEIYRNDPVNGAILQRLTDRLDGGIILQKGYLKTIRHSYRENLEQLLTVSAGWPALVADSFIYKDENEVVARFKTSPTNAPVFKLPGNFQMLRFLLKLFVNRLKFYYRDILTTENWNIGIIRKPVHEVALGTQEIDKQVVTWLPLPVKPGYLADPAGFFADGRLHILAEQYCYRTQKAAIVECDPVGGLDPLRVIESHHHQSYPFVFEYLGDVYCLPESFGESVVMLYRRDPETGLFNKVRSLIEGIQAVDPTLVFYNDRWWLFFTERRFSNTQLYIYFANDLHGEFIPHNANPVKTDVRSARPAGTPFIRNGMLYRPAQDCSVTYGGRVAVNRVIRLTPFEFEEETVNFLEPAAGSHYHSGLHTLSGVGEVTLIDGKRYIFDRRFFLGRLQQKLKRKDTSHV